MTSDHATLAEWLALHALGTVDCAALLTMPKAQPGPAPVRQDHPITQSGADLWALSAQMLEVALPQLTNQISNIQIRTLTQFAPDQNRYPRPFTLHDIGDGRAYVSCPCTGQAVDLVRISHEFGHVLQLGLCPDAAMPPVLRETCAFVAEGMVALGCAKAVPDLAAQVAQVRTCDRHSDLFRSGSKLRACLPYPDRRYDYDWNYPLARLVSEDVLRRADQALIIDLFHNQISLPELYAQTLG